MRSGVDSECFSGNKLKGSQFSNNRYVSIEGKKSQVNTYSMNRLMTVWSWLCGKALDGPKRNGKRQSPNDRYFQNLYILIFPLGKSEFFLGRGADEEIPFLPSTRSFSTIIVGKPKNAGTTRTWSTASVVLLLLFAFC